MDGVRRAVAEHAERGVDVIKVMASGGMLTQGTDAFGEQFTDDELRAVVAAAHATGLQVLAHAHSLAGVRHAAAAGVDGIEHFTGLTDEGLRMPDDVLELVAAAGIQVCPTVGTDPDRLPSPEQMAPGLRAALERLGLDLPTLTATLIEHLTRIRAHGIRVVSGTDAGISPPKAHGGRGVRGARPGGGRVLDARGARHRDLGRGRLVRARRGDGALRPGLAADLLVVDGDLAADPRALLRPVAVMVRGAQAS